VKGKRQKEKGYIDRFTVILTYGLTGIILLVMTIFFPALVSGADKTSQIEMAIVNFIRDYYGKQRDIQVYLIHQPSVLEEGNLKVKNITFARLPDSNGNGTCVVEAIDRRQMTRNVYVPFKVMEKKRIYVLKENMKRGEIITEDKIAYRDVILREDIKDYPVDLDEVLGKRLKRDLNASSPITKGVLEDHFVIKRNDIVSIVMENKKLMVKAKGRAIDRGRIGDVIRVKNLTSQKEITGRVVSDGVVTVDM